MTTPLNFNTPDRVIRMGLQDAGKLQRGSDPNPEQLADGMNRLNDIINLEQTQGLKLWLQFDLPIPLVAGKNPYTLGPGGDVNMTKPMRVIDSNYYVDQFNTRRPLILMSRDEYTKLSQTNQQGPINSLWPDVQQNQIVVSFWLVPDANAATGVAHLCIQQQVQNIVSLTDTMNFPQEWFMFLRWAFADDVCTGQPQAIMDRCAARAAQFRQALEDWDVEQASTSFAPDQRSNYVGSSFR